MWIKWLPWRFIIRHFACQHGFLDPVTLVSRLTRFSQPSEVMVPLELLRASSVLHARGLINSQAIQYNLDWIWPYWIERQFNPHDISFVPRAFSLTHINITHRNWTAVGIPDIPSLVLVDPRGLITPHFDGWSIDAWVLHDDGKDLIPSLLSETEQKMDMGEMLEVTTTSKKHPDVLEEKVRVAVIENSAVCHAAFSAFSSSPAWLVLTLRPYNPEGISFIRRIEKTKNNRGFIVNDNQNVYFRQPADHFKFSEYRQGDVMLNIFKRPQIDGISCPVGMATAAAMFRIKPDSTLQIEAEIPVYKIKAKKNIARSFETVWKDAVDGATRLDIAEEKTGFLFRSALHTVILHGQKDEVFSGPYTYKMFWFRDTAFIAHALICLGLFDRAEAIIDTFPHRQTPHGYFISQNGEWDSNGEVLWLIERFCLITNKGPKKRWRKMIEKGGHWIQHKLLPEKPERLHSGLFPPGFSAEHLGPNDYYYWDDFWGVAGLNAASYLMTLYGDGDIAASFAGTAGSLMSSIERSLKAVRERIGRDAIPASPYRRLDSGCIGSLAASYPLALWQAKDERILDTCSYLKDNCMINAGFFHDMSHSGINPYLTLHMAQAYLRAGDPSFLELSTAVRDLASDTGKWPEAVHPATKGGCMGDGEHVWAAAEWLLYIKNCFIREEGKELILCSGVPETWYKNKPEGARIGPVATSFGAVSVSIAEAGPAIRIKWDCRWHRKEPSISVRLPGHATLNVRPAQTSVEIRQ